ncbi:hypothetical protein F4678DRAFT_465403 [Xylaria arbuscula]|nr:hypothetical protein F4678DRAFT_465403 [Xylaria arbuscula]
MTVITDDTLRPHPHLEQTREIWRTLRRYIQLGNISIDGRSLDIAGVVAVSRLVSHDCTPFIPLRGTISASGDLMPPSYVAGSIMGNPDIKMQISKGKDRQVLSADQALLRLNIPLSYWGPRKAWR